MKKTMVKVVDGIGSSLLESLVIFENTYNDVEMQLFFTEEGATKHLDTMVNAILESNEHKHNINLDWELAITCDNVKLNDVNVLDMRILESKSLNSTCFFYSIEE